jgi:hypothetical protein
MVDLRQLMAIVSIKQRDLTWFNRNDPWTPPKIAHKLMGHCKSPCYLGTWCSNSNPLELGVTHFQTDSEPKTVLWGSQGSKGREQLCKTMWCWSHE